MLHIITNFKNDKYSDQYLGNKAKILIKLQNLGFNVPNFFVISPDVQDISSIQENIFKAYDNLNCDSVAVRSSAVGEDGLKKSFAGQYKSVLNVSKKNLTNAIRECLESLNTNHVLSYSQDKTINKMAIIVQKMVFAEQSGVSFSADPVKNDRSKIIIESVKGQCEPLVSGAVSPSHYTLSKNGSYEKNIPDYIKDVAQITKEIEAKLGYFVDIEWAISKCNMYILQARPITTLM
jgi:rifampicin phosphotransferase